MVKCEEALEAGRDRGDLEAGGVLGVSTGTGQRQGKGEKVSRAERTPDRVHQTCSPEDAALPRNLPPLSTHGGRRIPGWHLGEFRISASHTLSQSPGLCVSSRLQGLGTMRCHKSGHERQVKAPKVFTMVRLRKSLV